MSKPGKEISNAIYVEKAFAIVCVAAAHCASFAFPAAEAIRALIATLGVPIFLVFSGYFFNKEESAGTFWLKKLRGIVVPWVLWSILTYVLISLRGHTPMSLEAGLRWWLGYKTWLYFVPVLLACFAIFRLVKSVWWVYLNIAVSLASWTLTCFGILQAGEYLTLYQNPFNFTMFFAVGVLLKNVDLEKVASAPWYLKLLTSGAFVLVGIAYGITGNYGYWGNLLCLPFELLAVCVLFWLSYGLKGSRVLVQVGKTTYFTYFAHMIIGSGIANAIIWNRLPADLGTADCLIAFVKPALTVCICYAMCLAASFAAKLIKKDKWLWVIGL